MTQPQHKQDPLWGKLVRLAYQQPALRPTLLPLLKTASLKKEARLRLKTLEVLMDKGKQFGVLSAYGTGSKSENQSRHIQLVRDLQIMGYRRYETIKGSWEGVSEKSIMVPNMKFSDLVALGRKYTQDSVIYKSPDGVIGMYYPSKGYAEVAVDPDTATGEIEVHPDTDLYSKGRGVSFEFNFLWGQHVPWDGSKPLTKKHVRHLFESGDLVPAD